MVNYTVDNDEGVAVVDYFEIDVVGIAVAVAAAAVGVAAVGIAAVDTVVLVVAGVILRLIWV